MLTAKQADQMRSLSNYVGQTVNVLTSYYDANVSPDFKHVGIFNSASLRGLAAKGFIRIERTYWKGATITVLKAA